MSLICCRITVGVQMVVCFSYLVAYGLFSEIIVFANLPLGRLDF